jgi:hypothetical protein
LVLNQVEVRVGFLPPSVNFALKRDVKVIGSILSGPDTTQVNRRVAEGWSMWTGKRGMVSIVDGLGWHPLGCLICVFEECKIQVAALANSQQQRRRNTRGKPLAVSYPDFAVPANRTRP